MTLKQLEYFMEVARTLSFSKAAENLFMSQSALSRSISSLEDELGSILFFRNKHKVALTPPGIMLASYVPRLSAELDRTVDMIRQAQEGMRGKIVMGIQNGLRIPPVVESAIKYMLKSMPFISFTPIRMEQAELGPALDDGRVDFSLVYVPEGMTPPPNISYINIAKLPISIAAAADSSVPDKVRPSDVSGYPFVFVGDHQSLTSIRWRELCRSHGINPECVYCENAETRTTMIGLGMGLGVFPTEHFIFNFPSIKKVELTSSYNFFSSLVWKPENLNPSVDVFVKLIRADM